MYLLDIRCYCQNEDEQNPKNILCGDPKNNVPVTKRSFCLDDYLCTVARDWKHGVDEENKFKLCAPMSKCIFYTKINWVNRYWIVFNYSEVFKEALRRYWYVELP